MGTPIWAYSFLTMCMLFFYLTVSANRLQDLDAQVQKKAFETMHRKKTGIIYNVTVPGSYSGITAQVIRLRAGSLRRRGVVVNEFAIPKGVVVEGSPRSIIMVYKNFGRNSSYFSATEHEFVAPVVSILVYNASVSPGVNVQPELRLMATMSAISIRIPLYISGRFRPYCALFNSRGVVTTISELVLFPNVCNSSQLGVFSLVAPLSVTAPASAPARRPAIADNAAMAGPKGKKRSNTWKIALGAALGGIVAILALIALAFWGSQEADKAKYAKMERYAVNEETLQTSLIGNSRAPTAGGTRTRPVLENEDSI